MQTQDSLNFSRIFSRIEKVIERCDALEREDAFRVEASGSRLISSDIAQIRSDASRLDDADLRRTATAMSYVLESRANYGMAVAKNEYVAVAREVTKRDKYLNEARIAANTALGYEKLPLAYFTLGRILVASGDKSDATIAFQQVIASRDSDLTPHALEAIRKIGTSSRLSKPKIIKFLKFLAVTILVNIVPINQFMSNMGMILAIIAVIWIITIIWSALTNFFN
ncbi:hypothetical protein [Armatimonas rosea]|uniref:Tetratricopeptide repeat protein n=1 Tax=Armatimonas rosea TaxID=685828 RepID=A0A7W9SW47_ARMRO|nr:hypothetical protein [Armatimonas rosea]MBB6053962.1 hypothetical protein [Armatimonas rosea]